MKDHSKTQSSVVGFFISVNRGSLFWFLCQFYLICFLFTEIPQKFSSIADPPFLCGFHLVTSLFLLLQCGLGDDVCGD